MYKKKKTPNIQIIFYVIFLLIQLGILYAMTFSNNHQVNILYVSQNEILSLEQKRIEDPNCANKEMFFGKAEQAMREIVSIAEAYVDDSHKVVFSQEAIIGHDVYSISSNVYVQLTQRLQR